MVGRMYLLPKEGTFYKANLHCHTVLSDGHLTAEEVKKAYMEKGYSIVAFTDHRTYVWHKELDQDDFLSIAAYEVDINDFEKRPGDFSRLQTYHLNLYDTRPWENKEEKEQSILPERRYRDVTYINGYIERMKEKGFITCYNHPYWSLQTYEDYKDLRGLFAMEIYNHGCEHDGLFGFNPQAYDEMLRTGQRLYCVATDDNHNWYPLDHPLSDSFGGFTMIKARQLDYESVMEALKKGEFYYSMGPEIHDVYVEEGILYIKTSPVEKIYVMQEGRTCYKEVAAPGTTISKATFKLTGKEGYIRVQCKDTKGLFAGTNAYFMENIMLLK
ncbi:MAG TPA: PHP domain-containing protein [Candidatus Fimimorpha excrementavium]|nr:PHP domain-containing protein [Candidatus Fimimorpha excrementavium]